MEKFEKPGDEPEGAQFEPAQPDPPMGPRPDSAQQAGEDAAKLSDEEAEETVPSPAKPVDNPDLPEEGDPEDFEEEPIADEDFDEDAISNDTMDDAEELEDPNDLSGIDKEFDDDEDEEAPSTAT